jgi:hypothetical protein
MTRPSEAHLTSDEIEICVSGAIPPALEQHLEECPACLEQVRVDREIAQLIGALPLMGPAEGFADRVMARVAIPDPFALRSLQTTRRRLFATKKSLAVAATLVLALLGSMAGSIVWSLANQDTLASLGAWLFTQGGQAIWLGVQGLATNVIEQPWYTGLRSLMENPGRLAALSAVGSLMYLGCLLALRRLLAVPTQQVAHVGL